VLSEVFRVTKLNILSGHQACQEYMDRLVKEAIQIKLHYSNFNSDRGFTQAWYPETNMVKQSTETPMGK
jgi:hypothetical protein